MLAVQRAGKQEVGPPWKVPLIDHLAPGSNQCRVILLAVEVRHHRGDKCVGRNAERLSMFFARCRRYRRFESVGDDMNASMRDVQRRLQEVCAVL